MLAGLLVQAALLGGQHLDLLLHLHHLLALGIGLVLGGAQRVFEVRQALALLFQLRGQHFGLLFGIHAAGGQVLHLGFGIVLALRPLGDLLGQLLHALLDALAALDHVADLGLQLAHLGRGFVQPPLGLVDLVAGLVVRLAHGFQVGLDVADFRHAAFQLVDGLQAFLADLGQIALGVLLFQEPQLVLLERHAGLQRVVLGRHHGLLFQLVEVGVQLAQDVLDARQVLARVAQAVFGLAAALLVLGHAGRLFQEQAQLLGPRLDDAADGALADDGVGARAQAGAQEHVLHITAAHRLVVDEVTAVAIAREHALDGDFRELAPLAARAVVAVVEHQLHAGAAGRLAVRRAVEDHVLHALAAQLAGLALPQHPAHGIHDVGLSATVGADHADQLARQQEVGGFGEGLEAGELDRIKAHGGRVGEADVATVETRGR